MRFDLTDLRLFLNVVEAGSLTGGAARSHMTLASASQRVRGMEDALGSALLTRHAQGVRPTEAGRTLLHHARVVLQQMERLRGELGEYGQGLKGHVRFLCGTAALTEHLPEVLARFLAQHPRVSIDLEERASPDTVEALRAGLCDIGIVSDAIDTQGLECHPFRRDDLVLVMPRGHALATRRRVMLADVVDDEFVGLPADSALQQLVTSHARTLARHLSYRVRVRNFEAVCRLVEQGIGVAIVPQTAAARCARTMKIARASLGDAWAERTLMACVRTSEELPLNARRMLEFLIAPQQDVAKK
ncbi:LysR substrate-binding domain-containing protein [Variovorax sp. RCC_210]|uniref:LysR substrate-binding domain-containing protein n=1 Tax=Variovorax sp. RCC_210 TaxID=3239217 RepID=UPI0035235AB6